MSVAQTHAQFLGERNNVVIPNRYLELVKGDYVAAAVLKEVVYWSGDWANTPGRDGWFYRTEEEWESRCYLSRKQVSRAIGVLNAMIEPDSNGVPLITKKVRKIRTRDGNVLNETAMHFRLHPDLYATMVERVTRDDDGSSGDEHTGRSRNVPNGSSGDNPNGKSLTLAAENSSREQQTQGADAPVPSSGSQRETESPPEPPEVEAPPKGTAKRILDTYCAEVGIKRPLNYGKTIGQAQQLAKGGVLPEDIPFAVAWCRKQKWLRDGFDLGTILSQADKWMAAHVKASHGRRSEWRLSASGVMVEVTS